MTRLPLRARILLWFFGLTASLLACFSAMLYLQTRATLVRGANLELRSWAERIAARIEAEDDRPGIESLESRTAGQAAGETFIGGAVFALPGRKLVGIVGVDMDLVLSPPARTAAWFAGITPAEIPEGGLFFSGRDPDGNRCRIYSANFSIIDAEMPEEDQEAVSVVVTVAGAEDEIRKSLSGLVVAMVTAGLAAVFAAMAAGWFLADRIAAPIRSMAQTAEKIQGSDLDDELAIAGTGDEVDRLAVTLNQAFRRLRGAFDRQKHFTADASHEMRTPLSVIRTQAEVALAKERDGGFYRETLADILESAIRMQGMLESLLLLSRVDDGKIQARMEDIDLSMLAGEVAGTFSERAEKGAIELRVEATATVRVQGDRVLLSSAIANLLSNALEHTQGGKSVVVSVAAREGAARIEVSDEGEGIPPEAIGHVFERFYRVDESRSRSRGGAGLGLAIVKAIAEMHGGRASAVSELGKGSTFGIELHAADVKPGDR